MSFDPDLDRFSQGMAAERYPPWYGNSLRPQALPGVEGLAGAVAMISLHGPDGGMTYEQCEPVDDNHHRYASSPPIPNVARYS
jgi:hypothetical protein